MPHTPPALRPFPKHRAPLPPAYAAIYTEHYLINRNGQSRATSLSSRLERWLHRTVAADVVASERPVTTLELGAGTLNQLAYEPARGPYDVVEPFTALFEGAPELARVRSVYADIRDVPQQRYDRITSIAAVEHLVDLPAVVAQAVLRLQPHGQLRVSYPNEGTVLWRLGTRVTGLEFRRRYGLDYRVLMRFEHVNTAAEIDAVLRHFFARVDESVFGVSRRLALYRFSACTGPRVEAARAYLDSLAPA